MRQSCNEVVQADYFIILSLSTSYSGQLAYRTFRDWDSNKTVMKIIHANREKYFF